MLLSSLKIIKNNQKKKRSNCIKNILVNKSEKMASVEKALQMLRNLPRVALNNIKEFPEVIIERKKKVY